MNTTTTLPPALAALRDAAKAALDRAGAEQARREALLREAASRKARLTLPLDLFTFEAGVRVVDDRVHFSFAPPGCALIEAIFHVVSAAWEDTPELSFSGWLVGGRLPAQSLGEALLLAEQERSPFPGEVT